MKTKITTVIILSFILLSISGCSHSKTGIEEDLINQANGGFLYTSQYRDKNADVREYTHEREKSIKIFMNQLENAYDYSFKVLVGLVKYEENFLDYIDKIEDKDEDTRSLVQEIINKLFSYRIRMESYKEQIIQYEDMKSDDKAVKAMINSYILETTYDLVTIQNEYISWLFNNTATISVLLEPISTRQSEKVISSSESIYNKKIESNFNRLLFEFEKAAVMHSYIISADYYTSGYYLDEAQKNIENVKSGKDISKENRTKIQEEVEFLESFYNKIVKSSTKPKVLQPIPEKPGSLSFVKIVYAADETFDSLVDGIDTLAGISLTDDTKYDKEKNYGALFISDDIANAKEHLHSSPQKATQFVNELSTAATLSKAAKQVKEPLKLTIGNTFTNQMLFFSYQCYIRENNATSTYYSKVIEALTSLLTKTTKISDAEKEKLKNNITNTLAAILGNKKDEFAYIILTTKSEELINKYNIWITNTKNSSNLTFDKKDLADFLIILGVDIPEIFDATHIIVSYDLITKLDIGESNEKILERIYGWIDPLDYSQYTKEEKKDSNEDVYKISYYDPNDSKVGWESEFKSENIYYTYYFPNDNERSIEIQRAGTKENSSFVSIISTDKGIERTSLIRFRLDSNGNPYISEISEKQEGVFDGLYKSSYNSQPNYLKYVMGKIISEYTVKNNVVIREVLYAYSGNSVAEETILNYDNGFTKISYGKLNGEYNGAFYSYDTDGNISVIVNYINGLKDGERLEYYSDGQLKSKVEYSKNKKEGKGISFYNSGTLRAEGSYKEDKQDGLCKSYTIDERLKSEITYKIGKKDGPYHTYALGENNGVTVGADGIHAIGQYSDGKITGIWYYGYYNKGWVERTKYIDDVKIWTEYFDSNVRKYFKPSGSVDRTEKADKDET